MENYQPNYRSKEEGRTDQEIWNLVGNFPELQTLYRLHQETCAIWTSLSELTSSCENILKASSLYHNEIIRIERWAYDKLTEVHLKPSTFKFPNRLASDSFWQTRAFTFCTALGDTAEGAVV